MPSFRGSVKATETLTISGLTYYRRFKQNILDGNLSEVAPCTADATTLCITDDGVEVARRDGCMRF